MEAQGTGSESWLSPAPGQTRGARVGRAILQENDRILEWEYGELGGGFDRIVDMKELQRILPGSLVQSEAALGWILVVFSVPGGRITGSLIFLGSRVLTNL